MRMVIDPTRIRIAAFAGANLVLGGIFFAIVGSGNQSDRILAIAAKQVPVLPELPTVSSAGPVSLQTLQDNALFHISRHFFAKEELPDTGPAAAPPDYRLVGTVMGREGSSIAFIRSNQNGSRMKIVEGGDVEGWTVAQISAKSVALKKGQVSSEITSGASSGTITTSAISMPPAATSGIGTTSRPPGITMTPNGAASIKPAPSPPGAPSASPSASPSPSPKSLPAGDGQARLYRPPP